MSLIGELLKKQAYDTPRCWFHRDREPTGGYIFPVPCADGMVRMLEVSLCGDCCRQEKLSPDQIGAIRGSVTALQGAVEHLWWQDLDEVAFEWRMSSPAIG